MAFVLEHATVGLVATLAVQCPIHSVSRDRTGHPRGDHCEPCGDAPLVVLCVTKRGVCQLAHMHVVGCCNAHVSCCTWMLWIKHGPEWDAARRLHVVDGSQTQ